MVKKFDATHGLTVANGTIDVIDGVTGKLLTGTSSSTTAVTSDNISLGSAGDIMYQSAPDTTLKLSAVAVGNVLLSGGLGVAPLYGKVGLTTHVSGTLAVVNGGTGTTNSTGTGSLVKNSSPTFSNKITITGNVKTVSSPFIDAIQTWNNNGTSFTAVQINITDTASSPLSSLINLKVGGASKFSVNKGGNILSTGDINISGTPTFGFNGTSTTGAIHYQSATDSISLLTPSTSGSILTSGGVATPPVWSDILSITGLDITGGVESTSIGTGDLLVSGGVGITKSLFLGGHLGHSPTTAINSSLAVFGGTNDYSTSTGTGATAITGTAIQPILKSSGIDQIASRTLLLNSSHQPTLPMNNCISLYNQLRYDSDQSVTTLYSSHNVVAIDPTSTGTINSIYVCNAVLALSTSSGQITNLDYFRSGNGVDTISHGITNSHAYKGRVVTQSGKNRWNLFMDGTAPNYLKNTLVISGTSGNTIYDNVNGLNELLHVGGDVVITGTTESTSKTTGSLQVSGGVGIVKNLNVGGDVVGNRLLKLSSSVATIEMDEIGFSGQGVKKITCNDGQGNWNFRGGLEFTGTLNYDNVNNLSGGTNITCDFENSDGSIKFDVYKIGVAGNPVNVIDKTSLELNSLGLVLRDGRLLIQGTTESTSKTTGSLQVSGGVGIVKNLNVGGASSSVGSKRDIVGSSSTYATTLHDTPYQNVIGFQIEVSTYHAPNVAGTVGHHGWISPDNISWVEIKRGESVIFNNGTWLSAMGLMSLTVPDGWWYKYTQSGVASGTLQHRIESW